MSQRTSEDIYEEIMQLGPRGTATRLEKIERNRDDAEQALREITMICGYGDPSDGEGTSPHEVVEYVRKALNKKKGV